MPARHRRFILTSLLILTALLWGRQPVAAAVRIEVEKNSPAVRDGRLVEDIGLETLGGVFTPLLERGHKVPVQVTESFSSAADNQPEIWVRLARGTHGVFSRNHELGWFRVGSLPRLPRGKLQLDVTLRVEGASIMLEAAETGGAHLVLSRGSGPKKFP